jgi:exo-1,4-beta-D-glucosaminidase
MHILIREEAFVRSFLVFFCLFLLIGSSLAAGNVAKTSEPNTMLSLSEGWRIQSSAVVAQSGDQISSKSFDVQNWYPATVPTTVLAGLVKIGKYPDPYFGMNLRTIPGTTYPIAAEFSNLPMSSDSPFAVSWWYRTEFSLPTNDKGKSVWLHLDGLNYRANVWLNGRQVASSDQIAGAWRLYEFNVTQDLSPTGTNVLAIEVFPPKDVDLAIDFVDWNPAPPDKDMGLWNRAYLTTSGPVDLRHPFVLSKLDLPSLKTAHLTVSAEVRNSTPAPIQGTLEGSIEDIHFSQDVELDPGESREITFAPAIFAQLNVTDPHLWWPAQMGTPYLYSLELKFKLNDAISDRLQTHFGIREVTSEIDERDSLLFKVNGKRILIRGAGWAPDMMLRESSQRLEDEFRYVRDMNLNTVRLEGKLDTDEFFDMADRYGILVFAGWCCCDHWEHYSKWTKEDYTIAAESLRDQVHRLRSHPSLLVWAYGGDALPPPDIERMYLGIFKELRWPNPLMSSVDNLTSALTGRSGIKEGIYNWVPPSFWLVASHPETRKSAPKFENTRAGAFGFTTETSPGAAVPRAESLRQMLPKDHLWPIDDVWNFHAGGGNFKDIDVYADALNRRYGTATSMEDFARKAQLMNYEGSRAMFEAYSRNKYKSTGVIQWMLNNAWPSLIWHLYDYYLRPGGEYFGAKKACEPLHPLYSYDDHSIWVVNSSYEDVQKLRLTARVYNLDLTEKYSHQAVLDAAADSSSNVFLLPDIDGLTSTYFVRLTLDDGTGKRLSSNFYWLSQKSETLDWSKVTYDTTEALAKAQYGDFVGLNSLPRVRLKHSTSTEHKGSEMLTHVFVENPDRSLAMFVHLAVKRSNDGEEVLPVRWQDNYFSLLPGEKREITAEYRQSDLHKSKPMVSVDGWNVAE